MLKEGQESRGLVLVHAPRARPLIKSYKRKLSLTMRNSPRNSPIMCLVLEPDGGAAQTAPIDRPSDRSLHHSVDK